MKPIRNITVYCSSSSRIHPRYLAAARELGEAIAREGWGLVYGGNYLGSMAALADGARSAGGHVVGITPRLMVGKGYDDKQCGELVITEEMRQRKAMLEARGDAFVALPGGLGTLEELLEILVGRLLKYHDKPIVILDLDHYYSAFLEMIERAVREGFIKPEARDLYFVATSVAQAMAHLKGSHGEGRPAHEHGREDAAGSPGSKAAAPASRRTSGREG